MRAFPFNHPHPKYTIPCTHYLQYLLYHISVIFIHTPSSINISPYPLLSHFLASPSNLSSISFLHISHPSTIHYIPYFPPLPFCFFPSHLISSHSLFVTALIYPPFTTYPYFPPLPPLLSRPFPSAELSLIPPPPRPSLTPPVALFTKPIVHCTLYIVH